jgi:osmotically inducible lipoprotein OsmB
MVSSVRIESRASTLTLISVRAIPLEGGIAMKTIQRFTFSAVAATMLFGLSACAGMSARDQNTAVGAGVGAIGGSILTGGSAAGTIGGAAVGGIIGHEVTPRR